MPTLMASHARILYEMQTSQDDAQFAEPMQTRNLLVAAYLRGAAGAEPLEPEVAALQEFAGSVA
jgi:hypothetical protein